MTAFTKDLLQRAQAIFLKPSPQYYWRDIVCGALVQSSRGENRVLRAVASNTFRGYHRIDNRIPGAAPVFRRYFCDNRNYLIKELSAIESRDELHELSNSICSELRQMLTNCRTEQIRSYNKVRKVIDLYFEHLVAMAKELESCREKLTSLLFLPLDSYILQHEEIFSREQLRENGLAPRPNFGSVSSENVYKALQELASQRASELSEELGGDFHPIYLDLIWGNRYKNWGGNLFETNPVRNQNDVGSRCER